MHRTYECRCTSWVWRTMHGRKRGGRHAAAAAAAVATASTALSPRHGFTHAPALMLLVACRSDTCVWQLELVSLLGVYC